MAYSPAGNLTSSSGLAHYATVYYKRRGLDRLQKIFRFRDVTMKDILPKQNGRTVQWFRYNNLNALTTPTTEGTVGTSEAVSSNVLQAVVSQYTAFISASDLLVDTLIDPLVVNFSELLGYQAGLSVDTMTRNVIDAQAVGMNQNPLGTYLRVADLRAARHDMQADDVQPMESGEYAGWFAALVHPFASFDLVNDPAAGGLADIVKYNMPVASTPLIKYEDRGLLTHVGGCRVVESTNVFTSSGPNKYRTYIFGKNAVGSVDLEGRGPSNVTNPDNQRFKIRTIIPKGDNIADPEGVIGAAVSYNFVFAAVVLQGPAGIGGPYRGRVIDTESTLG